MTSGLLTFNNLRRLLKLHCVSAFLCVFNVQAGNFVFQVRYNPQTVEVVNNGNEQVFQLTLYALDRLGQWRPQSSAGGQIQHHLNPLQTVVAQHSPSANNALGPADPVLLLFNDASGNRFAHLAWRVPLSPPPVLFPFKRVGPHVLIRQPEGIAAPYLRSWVIGVPSQGIAGLAKPPQPAILPPPPVEMDWTPGVASGQSLTLDTGQGQRGVWLVHEAQGGVLYLQIIGDGITAGTEQMPVWLQFLKLHGYVLSLALIVLGGLLTAMSKISHVFKPLVRVISTLHRGTMR